MAETESSDGNFQITREEVERIGNALKSEEFRKLLAEYAEEVSDPANVKIYQDEITQLEKERGVDVTFINPEPGYVIKTSVDGKRKAFLNVSKNANIDKPTSQPSMQGNSRGVNWVLPHSLAPPRDDIDKSKNRCVVYDVVFHPEVFSLAEKSSKFKSMLTEMALDAVENNFDVKLDRRNLKFPKMSFKGLYRPAVIRRSQTDTAGSAVGGTPSGSFMPTAVKEYKELKKERNMSQSSPATIVQSTSSYTTPKYSVIHRSCRDLQDYTNDKTAKIYATVPTELVVEVMLPLLSSSSDVVLDVVEKSLMLVSESPAKYKLEVLLPYSVDEEKGSATFDQKARKLIVTLPVKYVKKQPVYDVGREDSGVECDHSCHTSESGSGDEVNVDSKECSTESASRTSDLPGQPEVGYRTSDEHVQTFLKPDICYSLPSFTCNTVDNVVVFTLHVKNVDASSVEQRYIAKSGIHLKFVSVGAGFFPLSYAFLVKFPSYCDIQEDGVNVETWDNNVILQIQVKACDSVLTDYFVGVDEDSVVQNILPEPTAVGENLRSIEISAGDTFDCAKDKRLKVKITKSAEDEAVEITCLKCDTEGSEDVFKISNAHIDVPAQKDDLKSGLVVELSDYQEQNGAVRKLRTYSESSTDELGSSPTKKGILKRHGHVSRSLSESSIDEYTWSSLDIVTHSGSESCIREEEEDDEERGTKKTVRFNDVICRKTFRPNSSILGQKKKNQRKQRNKKRAQERRASESENSEGEVEKEKMDKGGRTDKECFVDPECSVDDKVVSEEDDKHLHSQSDSADGQFGDPQKSSRSKGKKRNRKGSSKHKMEAVREMEFKNDLIFDIDM